MNLIFVIIDSLRADHVGCYGNRWIKTPNLDKLAQESVVFTQAFPEGLPTIPVRRALWTGRSTFPFKDHADPMGVGFHPRWYGWHPLLDTDDTVAEALLRQGYVTSFITDVYHMMKPSMNFHRGFLCWRWIRGQEMDAYETAPLTKDFSNFVARGREDLLRQVNKRSAPNYFKNRQQWELEEDHFAPQVFQTAMDWVEANRTHKKFFLLVDSFDPHEPWDPPQHYVDLYDPGYRGRVVINPPGGNPLKWLSPRELKHVRALYAGEATMVDAWLGKFIDRCKEVGVLENSLLAVITDHGHPLGEHGLIKKFPRDLHSELTHLVMMIRFPDGRHAGKRINAFVQNHDIVPTLFSVMKAKPPKTMDGIDLLPLIEGRVRKVRDYVITGAQEFGSVRTKSWMYINQGPDQRPALYDLRKDPKQRSNVAKKHPAQAAKLDRILKEYIESHPSGFRRRAYWGRSLRNPWRGRPKG